MPSRGARRREQGSYGTNSSWFSRLFEDPIALFTMVAAFAAAGSAFISYLATRDAVETTKLDNAPALYLSCTQKPRPFADIYYPVADVADYPGTYNDTGKLSVICDLSNISKRPLVNIRVGILALFYDRTTSGPTQVQAHMQPVVFPDDGGAAPVANRTQTINLAPNTHITLALPNTSYHTLFLDPADRADVQYPGNSTVRCADVYLAPGTLRALEEAPMQRLPAKMPRGPAGTIPTPSPSNCIDFNALLAATPGPPPWIPSVSLQGILDRKHHQTPPLQLPHQ